MTAEQRKALYSNRREAISRFETWRLEGRLALSSGKDGGSGSLKWDRNADVSQLNFRGTLGQGAWVLDVEPDHAVLELASGERWQASDVSTLVRENLGWDIPVTSLAWWVLGLSAPGDFERRTLDEEGRIEFLSQHGWNIEFSRYREVGSYSLPGKVDARSPEQSVKFVMREWTPGQSADGS